MVWCRISMPIVPWQGERGREREREREKEREEEGGREGGREAGTFKHQYAGLGR